MTHKTGFTVLGLLTILSMLLGACQTVTTSSPNPTQPPIVTSTSNPTLGSIPTSMPSPTATSLPTPTALPVRMGAWVDQLVFSEQNDASAAVKQIQAGDIDIYAFAVADQAVYTQVKADPKLSYANAVGSDDEITFNPSGPTFKDGRLNPFSNPKIREAMNWLIDRNYIAQEIFGGLAVPKYVPTSSFFADYARYIDTIRALEVKYAYNPDQAKTVITTEMQGMGATLGADGKWQFNNAPVTLIAIIRTEDARKQIGDYISNQLETIGFTVDRQYKTRSEASPIWIQSDPAEGKMHFYTGGWINTGISRDDSSNFGYYYTPLGSTSPLWQAYVNVTEFHNIDNTGCADKLWSNNFKTMDERKTLWEQCLPLALQDSVRVWLVDQISFSPMRSDLVVSYNLAGGVAGAQLYPYTIRLNGQEGGTVRIAQSGILVDPWNPIAGSMWIYDDMPQRATSDGGFMADPYTGLYHPLRAEKADVVVKEGLPVAKTLDWVSLTTAPSIEIPSDAWVDWDAKTQTFITAGDKYTTTLTALTKVTITYPDDLFTTVTWQDGSPISVGDFIMYMIMAFDPGKQDSPIYDEAQSPALEAFLSHFKGVKILSTNPFAFEIYDNQFFLDAETIAAARACFPYYGFGGAPWQTVALGYLADSSTDKQTELAFSTDKAGVKGVEWMSFIAGPSLDILKGWMNDASAKNFIPYSPTMSQFVSADEARLRWSNLQKWYGLHGHFWIGNGPFYLEKIYPVEKILTLQRFADYPDPASRWMGFGTPMLAVVSVEGPQQITSGEEPKFDVYVTFEDKPYPKDQINGVKYLVFDSSKTVVVSDVASYSEEGHYIITLSTEVTSKLQDGANILEVVVTSKAVSIPVIKDFEFISQAP